MQIQKCDRSFYGDQNAELYAESGRPLDFKDGRYFYSDGLPWWHREDNDPVVLHSPSSLT